jgi:hypothetical protein
MAVTEAISIPINSSDAAVSGPVGRVESPGKSFGQWLSEPGNQARLKGIVGSEAHQAIQKTALKVQGGARLSTRDLLLYQIRVHRFAARVELVSKAVESGMAAVRRFQNGS